MSGQYSSRLGASGAVRANATSRPSTLETIRSRSACSPVAIVPSGRVIRTGGRPFPPGGST